MAGAFRALCYLPVHILKNATQAAPHPPGYLPQHPRKCAGHCCCPPRSMFACNCMHKITQAPHCCSLTLCHSTLHHLMPLHIPCLPLPAPTPTLMPGTLLSSCLMAHQVIHNIYFCCNLQVYQTVIATLKCTITDINTTASNRHSSTINHRLPLIQACCNTPRPFTDILRW